MYRFTTNLKCQGCVQKVSAPLNNIAFIKSWKVEWEDEGEGILVVEGAEVDPDDVLDAVEAAGYRIDLLTDV